MRTVRLTTGEALPAIGQGTWKIGENPRVRTAEIAALRRGIDLGMMMIDTAEMYGEGASETLIGAATRDCRDQVFLVSKVFPHNAGRRAMVAACEASLKRLGTDRLDLYLLHWPGSIPLAESVETFERLVAAGKIRRWGVSNFDVEDMEELLAAGGQTCATNQVLYNITRRGPEFDLFPWMAERDIPVMAYSPIEQGRLPASGPLATVAARHRATVAQVAIAFTIRSGNVVSIPKASTIAHVEANRQAADLILDDDDMTALDRVYPPPRRKQALAML